MARKAPQVTAGRLAGRHQSLVAAAPREPVLKTQNKRLSGELDRVSKGWDQIKARHARSPASAPLSKFASIQLGVAREAAVAVGRQVLPPHSGEVAPRSGDGGLSADHLRPGNVNAPLWGGGR